MARLSPRDDARWRATAGRVAAAVERSLSPRVMANRVAGGGQGWSLEPVGPALRRARRAAAALGGRILVATDVAAFYPSVGPGAAFRALRAAGSDRADALEAAALLEGWGSHGYPGLPIGPPASAVVANAVLAPVDDVLRELPFLRWVDDYVVVLRSPREAAGILDRLDEALDRQGLTRSDRKTAIGDDAPAWAGGALPSAAGPRDRASARISQP
jgi:hypothetical protein